MTPNALAAALATARHLELAAVTLQALCLLSAKGPQTMTVLALDLGIESAAMTNTADRLVKQSFAVRRPCPLDRRAIHLSITDYGRDALADIIAAATRASWEFSPV